MTKTLEEIENTLEEAWPFDYADLPESPILDRNSANWVLRQIKIERRELTLLDEQYEHEMGRIQARRDGLKQAQERRLAFLMTRYEANLREFATHELEGKKERSITLLEGRIGFRRVRSSLEIIDKDTLLEWAKAQLPEAIVITESVAKEPVKSHIEATGEVVPGAEYIQGEDHFYME